MSVRVARRLERPGWVNARTALGLVLFVTSLVTGRQLMAAQAAGTEVWVAARDLAANTTLTRGDLRPATVDLPLDQTSIYAGTATPVDGAILTEAVGEGELLALGALGEDPAVPDARSIAIPITPEHAAGGRLTPGDRVDVLATFDAGTDKARTQVLVAGAEVAATLDAGSLMTEEASLGGITVSVPPEVAVHIAYAVRNAEIDIVRVDGKTGDVAGYTVRGAEVD